MGCGCNHRDKDRDEVITSPTKTVVKTRTTHRVRKHIHPTEVINVNRTVVRNEHFFPVYEREVNETVDGGSYNCGSDINRPRCRPFRGF